MRFAAVALALLPAAAFAAPIPAPDGILGGVGNFLKDLFDGGDGPNLGGIVGAVKDSIQNPQLLIARVQVVKGLGDTRNALNAIIDETKADNTAVGDAAKTALAGVEQAQGGVDSIGDAILSGAKPQRADQATVAQGIIAAETAINGLTAAVATPNTQLTKDIKSAVDGVALMRKGGEGVLAASGLKFEDLGLGAQPPAASGTKVVTPTNTAVVQDPAVTDSAAAQDPIATADPVDSTDTAIDAANPTGTAVAEDPVDTAAPVDAEDPLDAEDPADADPVGADEDLAGEGDATDPVDTTQPPVGAAKRAVYSRRSMKSRL